MPRDVPGVVPMIADADGFAALEWLAKALGSRERTNGCEWRSER